MQGANVLAVGDEDIVLLFSVLLSEWRSESSYPRDGRVLLFTPLGVMVFFPWIFSQEPEKKTHLKRKIIQPSLLCSMWNFRSVKQKTPRDPVPWLRGWWRGGSSIQSLPKRKVFWVAWCHAQQVSRDLERLSLGWLAMSLLSSFELETSIWPDKNNQKSTSPEPCVWHRKCCRFWGWCAHMAIATIPFAESVIPVHLLWHL